MGLNTDHYDYIIVGAGSAGCVMANRLSADPAKRVLLLEAGGPDDHPFIHMPRGLAKIIGDLKLIWPFATEPEHACNDTGEFWARGRVLGGSSAINGMMYVRGQAADYEELAELAGEEWDWPHIAQAYRELENHELGADPTRGGSGPLHISMPTDHSPLTDAIIEAGAQMGYAKCADVNDPSDQERVGYAPRTIHNGQRESAATAFLDPVRHRPNLTVVTGFAVDRILFTGKRATGVTGKRDGTTTSYHATREIIMAAGALATPAILQRSGVGPASHLTSHGIDVVQDLPGVGGNLREHRGIVMQWRVRDKDSENRQYKGWRLLLNASRYFLARQGPMTSAAYEIGAWLRLLPESDRLDSQFLIAPYTFDRNSPKPRVEAAGGLNICAYMLRPSASGTVMIRSADPDDLPRISPAFANDTDRRHMVALMREARRYVRQSAMAPYIVEETVPGPDAQTDEELAEAHRKFGYANYHACGTCRMGKDEDAPVDPRLRVRGTDGLRVADTSVFPFMLAGNTQAPAMAVAWRGADLILEDAAATGGV